MMLVAIVGNHFLPPPIYQYIEQPNGKVTLSRIEDASDYKGNELNSIQNIYDG